MPDCTLPVEWVVTPFVVTACLSQGPMGVTWTYGFASDDESDDPRVNLTLPFGLKKTPPPYTMADLYRDATYGMADGQPIPNLIRRMG